MHVYKHIYIVHFRLLLCIRGTDYRLLVHNSRVYKMQRIRFWFSPPERICNPSRLFDDLEWLSQCKNFLICIWLLFTFFIEHRTFTLFSNCITFCSSFLERLDVTFIVITLNSLQVMSLKQSSTAWDGILVTRNRKLSISLLTWTLISAEFKWNHC